LSSGAAGRRAWIEISFSVLRKFSRDSGAGLDFDVAEKTFAAFRPQTDFPGRDRRGRVAIEPLGVAQAHDDLAVDGMNAVAIERDQVERVPFALGFFGVHDVRTMIADGFLLQEKRVCAGGVVTPQIYVPARRHGDLRGDCVKIAKLILAYLKFKRARPGFVRLPGVAVTKIKQPGVKRLANFFAPFEVAPFDSQTDVDIRERRACHHHAKPWPETCRVGTPSRLATVKT